MLFVNLLLGFTTLVAFTLSLLIIVSNPKKRVNQSLFVFVLSIFLWLLANLLTNVSDSQSAALFFARTTLVWAAFIPYTFLMFVNYYVGKKVGLKQLVGWGALPFLLVLMSPTSLNIQSIDANGLNIVAGPAYYLLIIELLGYAGLGIWRLSQSYIAVRSSATHRAQIGYIFIGIVASLVPIVILNILVPIFSTQSSDTAVLYGPNAIIFLAIFTTLAIVKHQFLNIRLLVARSVGYILSIVALAGLYGLITFTLINRFLFSGSSITGVQQIFYTLLAVVIAFTFPPIKRFFDKITNRIFYRDAYDPQQLLDSLNKTLVSTIELKSLLYWVAQILSNTLKVEFATFNIIPDHQSARIVSSPENTKHSPEDLAIIRKEAPSIHRKILLTDELEDHPKLQKVLRDNDIALVARLVDSPNQNQPGLGYLLMGNKKSGNPYSSEDARVMEIIADELVIAVQNALRFDEIKDFNVTLQQRVEDATRKLRRTNEKLKQLDETKDDFISMASHQLRTPLTSVKGYVSMVLEGDAGKITPQQRKLLEQSFVSSQRMVYLIADLLNVSRLKTGKFIIEPKPTNLSEVVGGEIDQLTETAKGRGLALTYHKPHDFPTLNLDETKTRQVIMNFIDNAIYYTPTGGHIEVNLVDKPESIEFTVVDDGLGVPKHEQPHLFTKFYRAANARKARPDGTGLGLFMAKKVIIAQGGALIFKSHEGKGSTFGFSFPKKKLLAK